MLTGKSIVDFARVIDRYLKVSADGLGDSWTPTEWRRYADGMICAYQNIYGIMFTVHNNRLCIRSKHMTIGSGWAVREIGSWSEEFEGETQIGDGYYILGKMRIHRFETTW